MISTSRLPAFLLKLTFLMALMSFAAVSMRERTVVAAKPRRAGEGTLTTGNFSSPARRLLQKSKLRHDVGDSDARSLGLHWALLPPKDVGAFALCLVVGYRRRSTCPCAPSWRPERSERSSRAGSLATLRSESTRMGSWGGYQGGGPDARKPSRRRLPPSKSQSVAQRPAGGRAHDGVNLQRG